MKKLSLVLFWALLIPGYTAWAQSDKSGEYQTPIGNLRFKSPQIAINNINTTETKTDTVRIYNGWNQLMTLKISNLPNHITAKISPEMLLPQQEGIILVSYDASIRNDFGFIHDRFTVLTNDSDQPEKMVDVSANIIEDFSKMTPTQLKNAAEIKFESLTYDFGTITEGEKVEKDFSFSNIGKNDLFIRKIKAG
jgi:hypothetical protein